MEDGLNEGSCHRDHAGPNAGPNGPGKAFLMFKASGVGEGTQDFPSINSVTSFTFNMILKQKSKEFHQEDTEKLEGLSLGSKPIRSIHAHYKLTSY